MTEKLINHIGFMVDDLEAAMERWNKATGYTFRSPSRYTVKDYRDLDNPASHLYDIRLTMSVQGPPYIELVEPYGTGTHARRFTNSFHHLGFNHAHAHAKRDELDALGLTINGEAFNEDGRLLLFFTDDEAFYGTRLEYNQVGIDHPWFDEATGEKLYMRPSELTVTAEEERPAPANVVKGED